ncbi:hypothetical protein F6I39_00375 [Aerococcus loyolae]|uniref:branched-chain amino acid transport system II carrier protein n=1 Tax=Aerococcus loyolae TaxID=2976809 RepID=UPI001245B5E7|nr:branched-chain amino acid transport system II carrier protein [Aerococcus loyolae]KAA9221140.1 hypothetical protein F6I39_00375 [Aerococcus loyolae]
MKNRRFIVDTIVVGFTLFATFFGAGNLFFPPYMGIIVGENWSASVIGLALTAILVPVLSMVAIVKGGGSVKAVSEPIAPWFYKVFNCITMYLIALFILIPRTGATTYEVGFRSLFPWLPNYVVLIVFFTVVYFLTVDQLGVVDKIGRYLTPALIAMVIGIIIFGMINPVSPNMGAAQVDNSFGWAFTEGYQMGDLITGLLFSSVMIMTIRHKKYNRQAGMRMTIWASVIASALLLFIYGSLLWLGATASTIYSPDIERTQLLIAIVEQTIGGAGKIILSFAITLACLTTATGLLASVANFTQELTRQKYPYTFIVFVFCIFCVVQGTVGVEKIVGLSEPLFAVAYPLGIIVTLIGLFRKYIPNDGTTKGAVLLTTIYTVIEALVQLDFAPKIFENIVRVVPFGPQGFGWVTMALLGAGIGTIVWKIQHGSYRGKIIKGYAE